MKKLSTSARPIHGLAAWENNAPSLKKQCIFSGEQGPEFAEMLPR